MGAVLAAATLVGATAGHSGGASGPPWHYEVVSVGWSSTAAWRATSHRTGPGCPGVSPRSGRTITTGVHDGKAAKLHLRPTPRGARGATARLPFTIVSLRRGTYQLVECGTGASLGPGSCTERMSLRTSGAIGLDLQTAQRRARVTWDLPVATFGDCVPSRVYDTGDRRVAEVIAGLRQQTYPLARLDVPRGKLVTLTWLGPELEWSVRQQDKRRASTAGTFVWTARLVLRRL